MRQINLDRRLVIGAILMIKYWSEAARAFLLLAISLKVDRFSIKFVWKKKREKMMSFSRFSVSNFYDFILSRECSEWSIKRMKLKMPPQLASRHIECAQFHKSFAHNLDLSRAICTSLARTRTMRKFTSFPSKSIKVQFFLLAIFIASSSALSSSSEWLTMTINIATTHHNSPHPLANHFEPPIIHSFARWPHTKHSQ